MSMLNDSIMEQVATYATGLATTTIEDIEDVDQIPDVVATLEDVIRRLNDRRNQVID